MKIFKLVLPALILFSFLKINAVGSATAQSYYIYNFIRYIKWPANNSIKDFVIGVYGESDIYNELIKLATNRKVGTQNISIKKISRKDEINQCQLIYFPTTNKQTAKEIAAEIGNKPILLVSEASSSTGCTIEFVYTDNKLQFKIDEEKAKNQNLYFSQALINLAHKI